METICTTRVVPDRGIPMISTGVASELPISGARAIHSGVQRAIKRSISMENAAESNDTEPRRTASAASKCCMAKA